MDSVQQGLGLAFGLLRVDRWQSAHDDLQGFGSNGKKVAGQAHPRVRCGSGGDLVAVIVGGQHVVDDLGNTDQEDRVFES